MAWLKFDTATPEKPEIMAITLALGFDDPDLTVGKLLKVWRWFDQHSVDGNADVTAEILDRIVGVRGICEAMAAVGWMDITKSGISLPQFDKHCGITAKSRADTAQRVAKHRAKASGEQQSERLLIPRPLRRKILERHDSTCVYCGRKEGEYTPPEMARDAVMCIDHVIPVSRGGSNDESNMVCACSVCNMFKANRTPDECGLTWPCDSDGKRFGNEKPVTGALPREEKRREDSSSLRSEESAPAPRKPRATRKCPDDFDVTDALRDWATENASGVDLARETDKFRDYTFKTAHTDWAGAWRNWMRRAAENSRPPSRASPPQSKHAAAARAIYGAPSNPEFIDVETVVRQH